MLDELEEEMLPGSAQNPGDLSNSTPIAIPNITDAVAIRRNMAGITPFNYATPDILLHHHNFNLSVPDILNRHKKLQSAGFGIRGIAATDGLLRHGALGSEIAIRLCI